MTPQHSRVPASIVSPEQSLESCLMFALRFGSNVYFVRTIWALPFSSGEANHGAAFLGYHHVLMIILASSWILTALLLAGCTASTGAMSNIYVLGLRYSTVTATSTGGEETDANELRVRASYFGVCAQRSSRTEWVCASGASGLQSIIAGSDTDPLDIIHTGVSFKNDVLFPGLLIGAMALTGLAFSGIATFPGWHKDYDARTGSDIDIKPFPSRPVSQAVALALGMASLLLMISALWQHVAAASVVAIIATTGQGQRVVGDIGAASISLVWLSFALAILVFQGIIVMLLSINLLGRLDRLTDE